MLQCDGNCDPDSACPAPVMPPRESLPPLQQLEPLPAFSWLRPAASGVLQHATPHAYVPAALAAGGVAVALLLA